MIKYEKEKNYKGAVFYQNEEIPIQSINDI